MKNFEENRLSSSFKDESLSGRLSRVDWGIESKYVSKASDFLFSSILSLVEVMSKKEFRNGFGSGQ